MPRFGTCGSSRTWHSTWCDSAGILVLLESFGRFALQGIGTPAPVFPTRHLVVKGSYRYVRNPVYVALDSMILGQALLLSDDPRLQYAVFCWLAMRLFVLLYEGRYYGDPSELSTKP